jgi:hypothetical protein
VRRHVKKTDERWANTDYLRYDDLVAAGKLLDQAHSWIMHQLSAVAKGLGQADSVTAK